MNNRLSIIIFYQGLFILFLKHMRQIQIHKHKVLKFCPCGALITGRDRKRDRDRDRYRDRDRDRNRVS